MIDFDYLSKDAWKTLNVTYRKLSGSNQYDASFDAAASVVDCIKKIKKECPKEASLGTKKSALETLRKIGKSVCLGGDTLGREVRKSFQYESCLEDAMFEILKTLRGEERVEYLMRAVEGEKSWEEKVCELQGLGRGFCIFDGLDKVVALLEEGVGRGSGEGDDGDEDDGDGEEDD